MLGLVTLEDVIEELIGDFDDESDRRFGDCEQLPDGSFRMSGTTRTELFAECTGVELPEGERYFTVSRTTDRPVFSRLTQDRRLVVEFVDGLSAKSPGAEA